jgi:hypothetical protein
MPSLAALLRPTPVGALLLCGLLVACGTGSTAGLPGAMSPTLVPDARLLRCPERAFFGEPIVVVVPQDYGRIDLTRGHVLEFDSLAVPAGSRYRVSRALADNAALRIEPVDGAPTQFAGLARLTVNYAACNARLAPPPGGFVIYRVAGDGTLVPEPSADAGQRVSAFLTHFTIYAIGSN